MKDVLAVIAKLGVGGGIGFLVGIVLVWWIEPTTDGGAMILIVIPIAFCATVGGIVSALRGKTNKSADKTDGSGTNTERQSIC
jgi:hypothetical protein